MTHFVELFEAQPIAQARPVATGLHRYRTGQPVFVLAVSRPKGTLHVLKDEGDFSGLVPESESHLDRMAWTAVRAFFRSGGQQLVVLLIAAEGLSTDSIEDVYFRSVLPSSAPDAALRQGFLSLKNFDSLGDILAFPQASSFLNPKLLQRFYMTVQATLETWDPWFLLVDPPFQMPSAEVPSWLEPMDSAASAAYGPWITLPGVGFFPPSPLVSVLMERSDRRLTIADVPANDEMLFSGALLEPAAPEAMASDRLNRVAVRVGVDGSRIYLWGGTTLAQRRDTSRWIHFSRTLRSLREALIRISSPFVFEPKSSATCEDLKSRVEGFLAELVVRGVLREPRRGGPAFMVTTEVEEGGGPVSLLDATVHLNVHVCLDSLQERIGLYIKV